VQSNLANNRDIQCFLLTPFTSLENKDPDRKWNMTSNSKTRHNEYYILGIILDPKSEKEVERTEYEVTLLQSKWKQGQTTNQTHRVV
jgi:hypothetical protein